MKPTYLYIKTHNVTGLKYFGKTTNKDPIAYLGSGTYWKRHLKIHGNNITTEVIGPFEDKNVLKLYALEFSVQNNIVESSEWANLANEDGFTGGDIHPVGYTHSEETREKIRQKALIRDKQIYVEHSKKMTGKKHTKEHNKKISDSCSGEKNGMFGKQHSEETRKKISLKMSGKKRKPISEEHRKRIAESNRTRIRIKKEK